MHKKRSLKKATNIEVKKEGKNRGRIKQRDDLKRWPEELRPLVDGCRKSRHITEKDLTIVVSASSYPEDEFQDKRGKYIRHLRESTREIIKRLRKSEVLTAEDFAFRINALSF